MLHFPRWKLILVLAVVTAGVLFSLPNLFSKSSLTGLPSWLPHHQVNLGLDLQGGAHLLYQIDGMTFDAAISAGADLNAVARLTDDCRAGIARFLEKK